MPGFGVGTVAEVNIKPFCVCVYVLARISGARSLNTDMSRNPPTDIFPILVKVTHFECWEKRTFKKSFPVQRRA